MASIFAARRAQIFSTYSMTNAARGHRSLLRRCGLGRLVVDIAAECLPQPDGLLARFGVHRPLATQLAVRLRNVESLAGSLEPTTSGLTKSDQYTRVA